MALDHFPKAWLTSKNLDLSVGLATGIERITAWETAAIAAVEATVRQLNPLPEPLLATTVSGRSDEIDGVLYRIPAIMVADKTESYHSDRSVYWQYKPLFTDFSEAGEFLAARAAKQEFVNKILFDLRAHNLIGVNLR